VNRYNIKAKDFGEPSPIILKHRGHMNIDGVDFWGSNRHILHMWDSLDRAGPFIIMIDEKVRVNQPFTIFIQCDPESQSLYRILQRQCNMQHECNLSVVVIEPKSRQPMYDILFKVVLTGIKWGDVDYTSNDLPELYITYLCREAIDRTIYDKTI
jgi:hypothetical protein